MLSRDGGTASLRDDVVTVFRNLQISLDQLQRRVDEKYHDMKDIPSDDMMNVVKVEKRYLEGWCDEQREEMEKLVSRWQEQDVEESRDDIRDTVEDSGDVKHASGGSRVKMMQDRLLAMGGVPVLGGGPLPRPGALGDKGGGGGNDGDTVAG